MTQITTSRIIICQILTFFTQKRDYKTILMSYDKYYIRIYHECEGRIEKSVPRIAIWHHVACRVMTNDDPEGRIFNSPEPLAHGEL